MKVINKIQKLIAHEKSARAIGNLDEAAAFARRIQSLLDKHNLSMSEVELEAAQNSPIDIEPVGDKLEDIENWQIALLKNIARINGCYSLNHKRGFQVVVGRQIDREITINLYQYFENLGRELADSFLADQAIVMDGVYSSLMRQIISLNSSNETKRKSFLLGFVASVCQRLEETSKENIAASSNSAALVFLGDKQKENDQFMASKLNVDKVEPDKEQIDRSAFSRGAADGEKIALTNKTLEL